MEPLRPDSRDWIARSRLSGLGLRVATQATPGEVVGRLTAMQAQDYGYARWSVAQRQTEPAEAATIDAAFDEGRILRTHVLRPTWHYVVPGDLRWLVSLSGPCVEAANGRRYKDLGLDAHTLGRSNEVIGQAVSDRARTRRELALALEERQVSTAGRLSELLMHAELTAVICSGPMRGKQHTYAAFDGRVADERGPEGDEALAELTWRYFSTRGPATLADFSWWSGLGAGHARQGLALARSRLSSRRLDDRTYWFLDRGTPAAADRGVDLVQCFDELIISYRQSRDVLQTAEAAFAVPGDLDGFRHVVLLGGRLLGHWRAHPSGAGVRIETRTPGRLDKRVQLALSRAIERYRLFVGRSTIHHRT